MRTLTCELPLPYDRARVASLQPKTPGSRRRPPSNRLLDALGAVKLDDLPEAVAYASLLPAQARDEALGMVVDVVGWMIDLAGRGVHRVFLADTRDLMVEVLDPCRRCGEVAHLTRLPASYPLFCSEACLLEWADDNGRDLPRLEGLDDLLEKTREEAHDEGVAEAERKTDDKVEEALTEAMDSDDNPLLDVLRRFGSDPFLSVENAAWKLERLLRSGKLVL